jgi:hypothetical protein
MEGLEALLTSDPSRAIALMERLEKYVIIPHPGQVPVVESDARFKVLNCGRRWGKTKIGAKLLIDNARSHDNGLVWWVAPTYRVVKRGYKEVLRQLPRDFLTHDPPPDTNFDAGRPVVLKLKNGCNIEFYSAERPQGMLGEGVDFVVQDEAASTPPMVWEQIIRPTLADKQGGGVLISTPRARNWFYKRWLAGQDPENGEWASWTFPSWTNPYLPKSEIEAMRGELPSLIFAQEVEAKFLAAGSSVFAWEDRSIQYDAVLDNQMVEDNPPAGSIFLGIDLAKTTDFTVLYGAREDGRNVYFDRFNSVSWAEQKRRIARAVKQLRRAGAETVTLVMDSTGLGDPIQEDMEELGYDVIPVNFTSMKNKMVVRLAKDLEDGRALILDQAHVEEFENYAMEMTEKGRITYGAPSGEHDDVVSAKMLQHHGLVTEGAPDFNIITGHDAEPQQPQQSDEPDEPDDLEDDPNDWSDLIDDGASDLSYMHEEPVPRVAGVSVPPTPEELLQRAESWAD